MALTKQDISNCARHLEYDVIGLNMNQQGGASMAYGGAGFRFFDYYGSLLFRLQQLAPNEEAMLTGRAYGSIAFSGLQPAVGDSITVQLYGGCLPTPITATVVVPDLSPASPWQLVNVATALSQAFQSQPAFIAAQFYTAADYGTGPFAQTKIQVPICSIIAPAGQEFNIAVNFSGQTVPQVTADGKLLPPFLPIPTGERPIRLYGYLPILDYLEGAFGSTTHNQSLSKAEEVNFRGDEMDQRDELYQRWVDKLVRFIGIPRNPAKKSGNSGSVVC